MPSGWAHVHNRLVLCLFVEDIDLLLGRTFADILEESVKINNLFQPLLGDLFRSMKEKGGRFGLQRIPCLNGRLFDHDEGSAICTRQPRR